MKFEIFDTNKIQDIHLDAAPNKGDTIVCSGSVYEVNEICYIYNTDRAINRLIVDKRQMIPDKVDIPGCPRIVRSDTVMWALSDKDTPTIICYYDNKTDMYFNTDDAENNIAEYKINRCLYKTIKSCLNTWASYGMLGRRTKGDRVEYSRLKGSRC